jgi:hypothetical protein
MAMIIIDATLISVASLLVGGWGSFCLIGARESPPVYAVILGKGTSMSPTATQNSESGTNTHEESHDGCFSMTSKLSSSRSPYLNSSLSFNRGNTCHTQSDALTSPKHRRKGALSYSKLMVMKSRLNYKSSGGNNYHSISIIVST